MPLTTIVITPQNPYAQPNEQVQFTAKGYDENGVEVTFTPEWSVTKNS